jgi:hypothetical protein
LFAGVIVPAAVTLVVAPVAMALLLLSPGVSHFYRAVQDDASSPAEQP